MLETLLVLNAIWFAMAFNVFSIRNRIFAKVLVPREHRDTPVFDVLAESGRFLGGFNLAFALLNVLLSINLEAFPTDAQRSILLWVFAVAHGSQFAFNVPVAIQNRRGKGVWQVKGLMLFIFVTDFIMMVLNLALALSYSY
ncbi:hypothetical protein [Marinobacter arenosus]|uniref:hypothetical protein n=1 Tax=Marinobacter arenosus TaxID=2856822 RepID=UPI001C4B6982|nr:hypothetical protein [Marinobacter arenosus]MBW0145906.1 hypothetical protein [Marinobacter arenosus]